ncbi:MAG: transglycosylase SLT domain-containing protein [Bacteroidales bacterium]|nr:transglycosylase SLT domain-containing protein [Candidatus Cryptobacteroides choladohippi]
MKKTLALIVLAFAAFSQSNAQRMSLSEYFRLPNRGVLRSENDALKASLDSLQFVLDSLRAEALKAHQNDDADKSAIDEPKNYTAAQTDSLLHLWYKANRDLDFQSIEDYDMDVEHFTSNVPDEVMIQRLADMKAFFSLPFNETVKNYMILYSEKMHSGMERVLGVSKFYFPIFEETFAKYDIPLELKYMAIIESMLNPTATSRAGARGMWQFMYQTARSYGLCIDSYVDERLDVVKAVDAAARYLRDAYRVFGDWTLAISSYNCGTGNVAKAIHRAGEKRDFWSIYPYLPRETRGYVPAFVGAMYAFTYAREYGIRPMDVGMPAQLDTFEIRRKLHFTQISDVVGVPEDDLRQFNPKYIHDIVPGTDREPCILNLPYKWTAPFMEADQDSLYLHKAGELLCEEVLKDVEKKASAAPSSGSITYKVKSGDYLGRIASKYGVSVAQMKKWNNLKSDNIRPGQVLKIYK